MTWICFTKLFPWKRQLSFERKMMRCLSYVESSYLINLRRIVESVSRWTNCRDDRFGFVKDFNRTVVLIESSKSNFEEFFRWEKEKKWNFVHFEQTIDSRLKKRLFFPNRKRNDEIHSIFYDFAAAACCWILATTSRWISSFFSVSLMVDAKRFLENKKSKEKCFDRRQISSFQRTIRRHNKPNVSRRFPFLHLVLVLSKRVQLICKRQRRSRDFRIPEEKSFISSKEKRNRTCLTNSFSVFVTISCCCCVTSFFMSESETKENLRRRKKLNYHFGFDDISRLRLRAFCSNQEPLVCFVR